MLSIQQRTSLFSTIVVIILVMRWLALSIDAEKQSHMKEFVKNYFIDTRKGFFKIKEKINNKFKKKDINTTHEFTKE